MWSFVDEVRNVLIQFEYHVTIVTNAPVHLWETKYTSVFLAPFADGLISPTILTWYATIEMLAGAILQQI